MSEYSSFNDFIAHRPVHPDCEVAYERIGGVTHYAPHCDQRVLHAPGECWACDGYPQWQWARIVQQINFSGEHDPKKASCPSLMNRTEEKINRWPGNRPGGLEDTRYF